MNAEAKAQAFAMDTASAETYWQPKPANGYSEVHISRRHNETLSDFESGVQVVAPDCCIHDARPQRAQGGHLRRGGQRNGFHRR